MVSDLLTDLDEYDFSSLQSQVITSNHKETLDSILLGLDSSSKLVVFALK